MPIRILHVVTYMGRGGIETMLMNYYRNIDRDKVQFDFLVHREFRADYDDEIEALGGRIFRIPRLNPFSLKYRRTLDAFFAEHPEYTIVHSHLDCMAGIPLCFAKKNGVPIRIAHAHNNNQAIDLKYLLKLFYKRRIKKYATQLFACGHAAGKWMFGDCSFSILNNAIDAQKYIFCHPLRKKIREELGIPEETIVVGHVGRFAVQKNHRFLLDIFKRFNEQYKDSRLLLIGDGELRVEMENKCSNMDLNDKVIFTGVRKDVPELMQAMDVFVLPSLFEGLSLVLVEAQAAGLPCIISDKVPLESAVVEKLVKQISLSDTHDHWVDAIFKKSQIHRKNTYQQICDANYDIESNAEKLMEYYVAQEELYGKN